MSDSTLEDDRVSSRYAFVARSQVACIWRVTVRLEPRKLRSGAIAVAECCDAKGRVVDARLTAAGYTPREALGWLVNTVEEIVEDEVRAGVLARIRRDGRHFGG